MCLHCTHQNGGLHSGYGIRVNFPDLYTLDLEPSLVSFETKLCFNFLVIGFLYERGFGLPYTVHPCLVISIDQMCILSPKIGIVLVYFIVLFSN